MVLLRMLLGADPAETLWELPDPYSSAWMFMAYFCAAIGLGSFAGICSGLTLGLLSMSRVDLEVMRRTGTENEVRWAEKIIPVVADQHLLLVTLLLCNAFAAEALPLVIDRLANPIVAIILSMSVLLVMGEIVPQAICKSNALAIGATAAPLCRALIFICYPISWPIAKLLDMLLGEGHAAMFRRRQLEEFVDIHGEDEGLGGELTATEISIIKGALGFSEKTAKGCMTPLTNVFMLSSNTILSPSTFNKILSTGHSRIPIYNGEDRNDIMGVILVKELVGINPEAKVPITHVTLRSLPVVSENTPMFDMLSLFETGRSHMALLMGNLPVHMMANVGGIYKPGATIHTTKSHAKLVPRAMSSTPADANGDLPPQRRQPRTKTFNVTREEEDLSKAVQEEIDRKMNVNQSAWAVVETPEEPKDKGKAPKSTVRPYPTGLITIEDCIEELIQDEIIDETDRYVDNVQSERVTANQFLQRVPSRLKADFIKHFIPRSTVASAGTSRLSNAEGGAARQHQAAPTASASTPLLGGDDQ